MFVQPQWVTAVGSLGTIPEGIFYSAPIQAVADGENVYFKLISGRLPDGVQINSNGQIQGVPKNIVTVQGVPTQVSEDITSKFAVRAYTTINGQPTGTVSRFADRTFSLTVTGEDVPEFITPSGNVGTFYDGTEASVQIRFQDQDPGDKVTIKLFSGELPPGLVLNTKTGLISGVIIPLVGPPGTAQAGYSSTQYDQYPFDFTTKSASKNYQFTLILADGKSTNTRSFEIYVYSKDSMTADTTDFTADNTFITADVTPDRTPVLLTPPGDLGTVRADNFYAFKFDAIDFDGDPIEYSITQGPGIGYDATDYDTSDPYLAGYDRGAFSLPPGLQIDPDTGWFYGYIPYQGATQQTYRFAVRVFKKNDPAIISKYYYFTITIIGNIDTEVFWLTDPNLGSINNGAISTLSVLATNTGGRSLQYRLVEPGSCLPQGLTLQSSGNITGRVSFNTFALDGGTTTFDVNSYNRALASSTTFDSKFTFTVNAYAPESAEIVYKVGSIIVTNQGSGYVGQPTVAISPPPDTINAEQATAGVATIVAGKITNISLGNPGRGYTSVPTVTITGGGGLGATAVATIVEAQISNSVSVFRTFTVQVIRAFNEPYENLYVKCMPPLADRAIITQLVQNQDIIPTDLVYRADDPNFGVAQNVTYDHAYGLTASTYSEYISSLAINHYWKNVTLGEIRTARALDPSGNVLYEVVYSSIIDDLVNAQGESVGKEVLLPYTVKIDETDIDLVYPNSLINMRDQVIDTVGQVSPSLPLWMTSKQTNGQVLGFTPAWVIAYVKPGESARVAYNIREQFGVQLNVIDFKIDRYELDRSQSHNWDPATQEWVPHPPISTTFDRYSQYLYTDLYDQFNVTGTPIDIVTFAGDGTTTDFSITPLDYESLLVTINDVPQVLGTDYTLDYAFRLQTVVFSVAPSGGAQVKIYQLSGVWVLDPNSFPSAVTTFDGGCTTFNVPADRWTNTDVFDKYLVFPRINILN